MKHAPLRLPSDQTKEINCSDSAQTIPLASEHVATTLPQSSGDACSDVPFCEFPSGDAPVGKSNSETLMPEAEQTQKDWKANLAEIGEKEGFFEQIGDLHSALFVKRGETLIVTFENLDHVFEHADTRMPWGHHFVETNGWSMLGMMAQGWTWYRDEAVFDFFDRLRDERFFDQFEQVIFYGASMGGYAAAAFSAACPDATVICISPQATLDRDIASWETRYKKAWHRNFSSRYGFAPKMIAAAHRVYVFYDPTQHLDAMHAALFSGENVQKFQCRYFGHRIASLWQQIGILKPVILDCVGGTLTRPKFYKYLRARRDNNRYHKELIARLEAARRYSLVIKLGKAILARRRGPFFRQAIKRAETALASPKKRARA